mmetsp:Transcript_3229/g.9903  ORF Transcript_3229/g.9903 Transcript_3229/m.9903 type:complete len:206 (+) Transcript_3229:489-1106(+)
MTCSCSTSSPSASRHSPTSSCARDGDASTSASDRRNKPVKPAGARATSSTSPARPVLLEPDRAYNTTCWSCRSSSNEKLDCGTSAPAATMALQRFLNNAPSAWSAHAYAQAKFVSSCGVKPALARSPPCAAPLTTAAAAKRSKSVALDTRSFAKAQAVFVSSCGLNDATRLASRQISDAIASKRSGYLRASTPDLSAAYEHRSCS